MKENDNDSLKKDALIAAGSVVLMIVLSFALNWASSANELSQQKEEMLASAEQLLETGQVIASTSLAAEADKLPSSLSEATNRTAGKLLSVSETGVLVALVAVGAFLSFLVLKLGFPKTLGKIGTEFNEGWAAMPKRDRTKWQIVAFLVIFFAVVAGRSEAAAPKLALPISDKALETIIYYEVGGKSYYNARLHEPTVPAWRTTVSGVTVGFGVDCGHMTRTQIKDAFEGILTSTEIRALQSVSGMKGRNAYYNGLPKVRGVVDVSWDEATAVFRRNTLPRFTAITANTFNLKPGRLHPHENGALLSLVFNRGGSLGSSSADRPPAYFKHDRRMEMRQIKFNINRGYAGYVPGHIRSMKRLWSYSSLKGLHLRRNAEADLFAYGSRVRIASR